MKLANWLSILGLVITAAGLLVNLGNLRGWFAQADRVTMLTTLTATGAIPANAAAFPEILAAFPPPARFDLSKLSGLQMPIGIASDDASTTVPPLQYRFANGFTEPAMSFEQLQVWSGIQGHALLSLLIGFSGLLITLVGVLSSAKSARAG
ncbi:hypothetical protein [Hydrocarboniphaga sp.]|uniref:hypothetical protein n=1 Tax=Hydrocarboniphaga sp. TaxID=2033016 RepID=UPI003D0DA963